MSRYLLKEVKTFRADTELEAASLIDKFKREYDVINHQSTRKEKKDETYYVVKITIRVNDEKYPNETYSIV